MRTLGHRVSDQASLKSSDSSNILWPFRLCLGVFRSLLARILKKRLSRLPDQALWLLTLANLYILNFPVIFQVDVD